MLMYVWNGNVVSIVPVSAVAVRAVVTEVKYQST